MKCQFTDETKVFVYGALQDCEIAASIKNNKKFRKLSAKLKLKFTSNSSYVELKYSDFWAIKEVLESAIEFASNAKQRQEELEAQSEEEEKAIQHKIDDLDDKLTKARNALGEFAEVANNFAENFKVIAEQNAKRAKRELENISNGI